MEFTTLQLPATLGLNEAVPLCESLRGLRGQAVMLDASRVEHLGGLCLQVLLSARKTWAADDVPMAIANSSSAFTDALALFGASALAT